MRIFERIEASLFSKKPFVVYKKPNETCIKSFFQKDKTLYFSEQETDSGFIFAPFDNREQAILIPASKSEVFEENIQIPSSLLNSTIEYVADAVAEEKHVQLVRKGIEAIEANEFQKVVLSRKEQVGLENFDVVKTLKKLLVNYPTAFVYVWYHPEVGMWFGATPETLVAIKGLAFKTMSLAGTQVFNSEKEAFWGDKELEEQQIVTDYIADNLKAVSTSINVYELQTIRIGNLLHLQTKITGTLKDTITDLIKALHPTPAVCGFPKEKSKAFILENENYNRKFYTGFLGEFNLEDNIESIQYSNLYVNLRCMEVHDNSTADIYIGGGITQSSIPKKEWEETKEKSKAMKNAL